MSGGPGPRGLIAASRPLLWVNTAFPFLAAAYAAGGRIDLPVLAGFLYFLLPYNLLMYGVNDLHDYASDLANPRKGSLEGAILPPVHGRVLVLAVLLTNLPLILVVLAGAGPAAAGALLLAAGAAWIYSAPPLRTKVRPGLDSLTSASHFVLPAVAGFLAGGLAPDALPWPLLLAFLAWGVASHALGAIQDITYDRAAGIGSIATALGPRGTALVSLGGYAAATAIVALHGTAGIVASVVLAAFLLLPAGVLAHPSEAAARRAWGGFLVLCLLAGVVLCHLLLRLWGVTDWSTTGLLVTLGAGAAGVALAGGLARLLFLPRAPRAGTPAAGVTGTVAVIAARNEAHTIGGTIAALRAAGLPATGIVVVDDGSTDGTAEAARAALGAAGRILAATPAPEGWASRTWALAHGVAASDAPRILLLDAGTRVAPDALARLGALLDAGAALASAEPAPEHGEGGPLAAMPALLRPFPLSWLAARRGGRPAVLADAADRLLLVDRAALAAAGGLSAVAGAVGPGRELARRIAGPGGRVALVRGVGIARSAGPESVREHAERWRAILAGRSGENPAMTLFFLLRIALAWLLPLLLLPAGLAAGDPALVAGGAAALGTLAAARIVVALVAGDPATSVLWHPVTVLAAIGLGIAGLAAATAGRPLSRRGRPYPELLPGRPAGVPAIPVPAAVLQPGPSGGPS